MNFIKNKTKYEILVFGVFLVNGTLKRIALDIKTSKKSNLANLAILNSMAKLICCSRIWF